MYYYTNHIRIRESTYFERKHIKYDFEKLRFHSRSVSDRSEFRGLNKFPGGNEQWFSADGVGRVRGGNSLIRLYQPRHDNDVIS